MDFPLNLCMRSARRCTTRRAVFSSSKLSGLKWFVLLRAGAPPSMPSTLQSATTTTPETKAEWPSRLWKLFGNFARLHTPPLERRNFLLSKKKKNRSLPHSTSKLCVSVGPEPSGSWPVLLQVRSITVHVCVLRRAFNLRLRGCLSESRGQTASLQPVLNHQREDESESVRSYDWSHGVLDFSCEIQKFTVCFWAHERGFSSCLIVDWCRNETFPFLMLTKLFKIKTSNSSFSLMTQKQQFLKSLFTIIPQNETK